MLIIQQSNPMNYAKYFAIEKDIKQKGFEFDRSELIHQFTAGRKSGLKDLTYFEYAEFLSWISRTLEEKSNQMRRKIIALFHKMGYKLEGSDKINMKRVNDWCIKYGHKHVELNAYNYNELCALLTQAEKYYKTFIEAL